MEQPDLAVVEAVIATAGLARYAEDSDALFAFGVVVALLAEPSVIATSRVDSAPKAALRE
ncbi:MAG: hypothetical protein ACRDU5_22780 [Mycobacterium sp.]